jgi:hypothetical protein
MAPGALPRPSRVPEQRLLSPEIRRRWRRSCGTASGKLPNPLGFSVPRLLIGVGVSSEEGPGALTPGSRSQGPGRASVEKALEAHQRRHRWPLKFSHRWTGWVEQVGHTGQTIQTAIASLFGARPIRTKSNDDRGRNFIQGPTHTDQIEQCGSAICIGPLEMPLMVDMGTRPNTTRACEFVARFRWIANGVSGRVADKGSMEVATDIHICF